MLGSCRKLVDGMLIEDLGFDFKWPVLVLFLAIEQDIVHAKAPGVNLLFVPCVYEL